MTKTGLFGLVAATALLVAGAVAWTPAATTQRSGPGAKFLGDFDLAAANRAASLTVLAKGKSVTVEKKGEAWTVKELGSYPADPAMVTKALNALVGMLPHEVKTADPKRHDKLDLDDPKSEKSSARQLTVRDAAGKVLADVIVGKSNNTHLILGKEMVYVRKAGDDRAWLVEGDPGLKSDTVDWVLRDIMGVVPERVRVATNRDKDGKVILEVYRDKPEDKTFQVRDVPAARKLKDTRIVGYVAETLDKLALDDVRGESAVDFAKNAAGGTEIRTFDGLVVKVRLAEHDKKVWASFEVSVDEAALLKDKPRADLKLKAADEVKKEADEIAKRVKGWAYVLPNTASRFMAYKMDDVLEAEKKDEEKK
jgi:hypothetical protein